MTSVAVNLLWCVPGDVGGSEEYLVRQLLGLADRREGFVPTLYCLPAFVDAHPELVAQYPVVAARITGADRPRRVLAENTWLARRTRPADVVHHGGGTVPTIGSGPIVLTIHDLQYLTYPGVPDARQASLPAHGDPAVDPPGDGHRDAERVRQVGRRRALRHRSGRDRRRPPRGGTAPRLRRPERVRSAARLRARDSGPVLVFPAITHPHKGHRFLLEVMARTWTDPDLRLVLLGGSGAVAAEVDRAIVELGSRTAHHPARPRAGRRPRRSDRAGGGTGLPERVRGVRRPGRRGDGPRHARRVQRPAGVGRGRGRRRHRAAARPSTPGPTRWTRSPADDPPWSPRAAPAPPTSPSPGRAPHSPRPTAPRHEHGR